MIFCLFGGPGPHFGGLGSHFDDFWDCCDFGDTSGAKEDLHFDSKMQPVALFFQSCVFDVFLNALFLFFL